VDAAVISWRNPFTAHTSTGAPPAVSMTSMFEKIQLGRTRRRSAMSTVPERSGALHLSTPSSTSTAWAKRSRNQ
jgi:hypothetical protein